MRPGKLLLFVSVSLLCTPLVLAQAADSESGLRPGVVVEKVLHHGACERAGIRKGDLLLRWTRGDAGGPIHSPFDLWELETEEAPLGPFSIEGVKGKQKHVWTVGSDPWGLLGRPNLSQDLLSIYQSGVEMIGAGEFATLRCRSASCRRSAVGEFRPIF
jgi:hypothetical protein